MTEEIKNTPNTPEQQEQKAKDTPAISQTGSADFPSLLGNIGLLIDTSLDSVTRMINSATAITQQISENITLTANSDVVKGMVDNISSVSQNVIKGVNDTLNSEQLKKTFDELGKLASGVIDGAGSIANSQQAQNLFNTVSSGLNQLIQTIVTTGQQGAGGAGLKKAIEIPFCSTHQHAPSGEEKQPSETIQPQPAPQEKEKKTAETVKPQPTPKEKEQKTTTAAEKTKPAEKGKTAGSKKEDISRKGMIPPQK